MMFSPFGELRPLPRPTTMPDWSAYAKTNQLRSQAVDELWADPIVNRYLREHPKGAAVREPWEVLGEQRAAALHLLLYPERYLGIGEVAQAAVTSEKFLRTAMGVAALVLKAVPVLWLDDMRMTATASKLPDHVIADDALPLPLMWWTYENGGDFSSFVGKEKNSCLVDSILLIGMDNGIGAWTFGSSDGQMFASFDSVQYGWHYPEDAAGAGPLLSMLSFMNSPYVMTEEQRLSRADRRAIERCDPQAVIHPIKVIRLRNPEAQQRESSGASGGREYSHRWLVRGHHRAQWYPSKQEHKVTWIAPYIKGPADKDFRPPMYAVVR